jgi:uncharacterized damage-inducible protein DinB
MNAHEYARFNAWANERLHKACGQLTPEDLRRDRKAFFRSIMGTLNHILLVDMLYRDRLEGRTSPFKGLDDELHAELGLLSEAQHTMDQYYVELSAGFDDDAMDSPLEFVTLLDAPEQWRMPRWIYFTNLFQHQIHHRGQIHDMLSQCDLDPPPIGFVEYPVELGTLVERTVVRS